MPNLELDQRSQPPWMTHAWSELGLHERAGSDDEVPWCASFVGAMLERGGHLSTRSLRARSYLDWGDTIDSFQLGAIAIFSRGDDPAAGHVGFIVGETSHDYLILGGNQSDAVSVAATPKDRLLGLRLPPSPSNPSEPSVDEAREANTKFFDAALAHVLKMEGGFTDDPQDPGGPTNLGITVSEFAKFQGHVLNASTRPVLLQQLKQLTLADVRPIYQRNYWVPSHASELPTALAVFHFDCAVNHGITGAARMLQSTLGVEVDGYIGPNTLRAGFVEPTTDILERYAETRRARYRALPHFARFGRGWLNRTEATVKAAQTLAARFPDPPAPPPVRSRITKEDPMTDESASDATIDTATSATTPKWWGHSLTIWGVIVTTLSTVLPAIGPLFGFDITAEMIRQIGGQLAHLIEALGGVVGILLTIAGRMRAVQPLMRRPFQMRI
jgi:uncharacterized protein (TIGR02594 family)